MNFVEHSKPRAPIEAMVWEAWKKANPKGPGRWERLFKRAMKTYNRFSRDHLERCAKQLQDFADENGIYFDSCCGPAEIREDNWSQESHRL